MNWGGGGPGRSAAKREGDDPGDTPCGAVEGGQVWPSGGPNHGGVGSGGVGA
jgi:hypothetical protein